MRVKIHKQIETFGKTGLDRRHIREEVRDVIYTQLVAFENQSKRKTDVYKKSVKELAMANSFSLCVC
jgi:1-acyl-sn-glycerol-3-phosphate acyltransferase